MLKSVRVFQAKTRVGKTTSGRGKDKYDGTEAWS